MNRRAFLTRALALAAALPIGKVVLERIGEVESAPVPVPAAPYTYPVPKRFILSGNIGETRTMIYTVPTGRKAMIGSMLMTGPVEVLVNDMAGWASHGDTVISSGQYFILYSGDRITASSRSAPSQIALSGYEFDA